MPPFNQTKSNLMQQMQMLMPQFCDKCGTKYGPSDNEIITSTPGKSIVKLSCHSCNNSYMIHVTQPAEGLITAKRSEFKSEISAKEMSKFSKADLIDSDELIDLHKKLKGIDSVEDLDK